MSRRCKRVFISLFGQEGDTLNSVFQIVYLLSFLIFMFYGQKIQTLTLLRDVGNAVKKLKTYKDDARRLAIDTINELGQKSGDISPRIDHLLEYFMLMPRSMDPNGIVPKIEHLVDVRDHRFKNEIKIIAPEADKVQSNNIEGVLEVALGLNSIYKIVNHFYLLGRKTLNIYVIMQVQMQLPMIMQLAEAFSIAGKAFALGQPIGDGAGALVAAKMMHGSEIRKIAKDTVSSQIEMEGRKVYVIKAEGPGSEVGKPNEGILKLVEENAGEVSMIIMVDAAGKLEGEESGSTAEGTGAIIGGIGVEAFKIEEMAVKYNLPVTAVAIKQSNEEAYTPMTNAIYDGVNVAIARVKRIIHEETNEGDTVILVGVGNTVGIGQ
jgi:hypothetical protein